MKKCDVASGGINMFFKADDISLRQTTLPVNAGGLGFTSAVDVALSTYLASAARSCDLVWILIAQSFILTGLSPVVTIPEQMQPVDKEAHNQKAWDSGLAYPP